MFEVEADEVGPSLRNVSAKVTRVSRSKAEIRRVTSRLCARPGSS
jgi:hypothetical protein